MSNKKASTQTWKAKRRESDYQHCDICKLAQLMKGDDRMTTKDKRRERRELVLDGIAVCFFMLTLGAGMFLTLCLAPA